MIDLREAVTSLNCAQVTHRFIRLTLRVGQLSGSLEVERRGILRSSELLQGGLPLPTIFLRLLLTRAMVWHQSSMRYCWRIKRLAHNTRRGTGECVISGRQRRQTLQTRTTWTPVSPETSNGEGHGLCVVGDSSNRALLASAGNAVLKRLASRGLGCL